MTFVRQTVVETTLHAALAGRPCAEDWTMGGFDATLADRTAESSTGSWANQPLSWTAPHGAQLVASPVVADGVAVDAAMDGNVNGLSASPCGVQWKILA